MLLCIVITSVILPSMPRADAKNNITAKTDTSSVEQNIKENSKEDTVFIIKEYNGMIAVFNKKSDEPLFVSEVSINNLPLADKKILQSGIEVFSEKELKRLIEDYCS